VNLFAVSWIRHLIVSDLGTAAGAFAGGAGHCQRPAETPAPLVTRGARNTLSSHIRQIENVVSQISNQ